MSDKNLDMRRVVSNQWNALAGAYQDFRSGGDAYNDLVAIPAMQSLLGELDGLRVLDAGCGTGELACYCAESGAEVTGVDIAQQMVTEASRRAADKNLRVNFITGDFEDLPELKSGCFDVIILSVAIAGRLSEIIAEANRLLRVGGSLCIAEVHPIVNCGKSEFRDGKVGLFVSDYFDRSIRKTTNPFGKPDGHDDVEFVWQNYTLADYFDALWKNDFVVERYLEPEPVTEKESDRSERAKSYPIFFLIKARKE